MRISLSAPCCTPLQTSPLTEADAEELAGMLKALADPVRLRLLSFIATTENGEACACDLTEPTGRSQATVSHHLSQLTQAGILEREQRGKWAWFTLDRDRLNAICAAVCATSID
jgi:ArsR family transcriptional regulator